jgi:hypothetical protein
MTTAHDNAGNPIAWIETTCTGNNPDCKAAMKEGRRVHLIPHPMDPRAAELTLALPTYHYKSEVGALAALALAWTTGVIAYTADERDAAYARGVPVKIAKGVRRP